MKRGSHHQRVGALHPKRTSFDLSYEKKFTCDVAELIPVMCDEVVPGDHFSIKAMSLVRCQPMFAPLLHEVKVTTHYFFVPYRLLLQPSGAGDGAISPGMSWWEAFITGGPDGNYVSVLPTFHTQMQYVSTSGAIQNIPDASFYGKRSLWDYFGFPLITGGGSGQHFTPQVNGNKAMPLIFPYAAYNFIWQEYYRDENYQPKPGHYTVQDITIYPGAEASLQFYANTYQDRLGRPYLRNWTKDYFTSALPWQQRGQAPAFPISGNLPVTFTPPSGGYNANGNLAIAYGSPPTYTNAYTFATPSPGTGVVVGDPLKSTSSPVSQIAQVGPAFASLNNAVSFNVSDLRHIIQLQKWLERNARGGIRYTEFLQAHFGVSPRDDRLQRPEYIGGVSSNIQVSEVLQTSVNAGNSPGSSNTTPQGNMSGHGVSAVSQNVGSYFVKEYGLIMGIMSIMPTPSYEDGIDRQWRRRINTDFYFPEFVNLSEQGIEQGEIYATGSADTNNDLKIWGFQPQYDEMRIKRNMVCADFRVNSSNNISFWHMGRSFSTAPTLSSAFVRCNPDQFDRCFAVNNFPMFMVSHANVIRATRPLPYIGEPGLVDHH